MNKFITLYFVFLSFLTSTAFADLNQSQQNSLYNTQKVLKNREKRMKAVNSSKEAQDIHKEVISLFGSDHQDKAYEMAAVALEVLAKEANGDSAKMAELLNKAKRDPAGFANRMPPEFRTMLRQAAQNVKD